MILIPVIIGTSWYVYTHVRSRPSDPNVPHVREVEEIQENGVTKYVADPGALVRPTVVVVDQDLKVEAHTYAMYSFTLPSERPVRVTVTGKQDSAKGFSVYLMTDEQLALRRADKPTTYYSALSSMKGGDMQKTAELGAGTWNVVVENSENILKTMTVHVKIVSDP